VEFENVYNKHSQWAWLRRTNAKLSWTSPLSNKNVPAGAAPGIAGPMRATRPLHPAASAAWAARANGYSASSVFHLPSVPCIVRRIEDTGCFAEKDRRSFLWKLFVCVPIQQSLVSSSLARATLGRFSYRPSQFPSCWRWHSCRGILLKRLRFAYAIGRRVPLSFRLRGLRRELVVPIYTA
jgi:hypothetical protein